MSRLPLLTALLVCLSPLHAQNERATVTGVVLDPSRSVVPGAAITLLAASTGIRSMTMTNSAGVYTFSGLPIGKYSLSVQAQGFDPLKVQSFSLEVGETRTQNITLNVGAVSSNVTVVEAAPDLNLSSSEVGGVITGKQTDALPVNGRYWASLMALIPGAIVSGTGTQDSVRFAGLSQEDNNFRFDGVDATGINHQYVKDAARLQFPMESIAEFKASSAVYTADIGGTAGGQVSMVSKTGSNELHGSLYEYLRNSFFDARQFNAATVAPMRLNNFGGSLGGAIIKSKLFYFVNYEAVRQMFYKQNTGFVPTDAYRAQVIAKSPALAPIINAWPKGTIPTADPNALLWIANGQNPTYEDAGLIRIDYAMSDKTLISFRYNQDDYRTHSVALAEGDTTTVTLPNAVLDVQHRFSPSIMNDLRFGFNRDAYLDLGDAATPYSVNITGFASFALGDHSGRFDNSYSILDNAVFYKGRHTFKAGFEIRRMQENKIHPLSLQSLSYLSEQDFINNKLDSYSYTAPGIETQARKTPVSTYLLDEFKVRPNFTVNVGLRYEYFGVDRDKNNVGRVFDPFTCGLQYCAPGTSFYNPNLLDLAPRVSIAWSPERSKGKTAIRAGYGIFYNDGQFGGLYAASTNIGLNFSLTQKTVPGLAYPFAPFLGEAAYNISYSARDRNRKDVANNEWTFSIEHEILKDTFLQVGYLGTKGYHLFRKDLLLNGINPLTGTRPFASLTSSTIGWVTNDASSNLNALQVRLRRNLSRGLLLQANYQWSHGLSDGSNGGGESDQPQNMNCRSCEYGATDFDVRHNFTTSAIWLLPVGKGRSFLGNASRLADTFFGGWQLSGIGIARTGLPGNVTLSRSASALPDGLNQNQRPDIVSGQPLFPAGQNVNLWLNPYAFTTPANGLWGNAPRNAVRVPGIWQIDTSLEKRFPINERLALTFRGDLFNIFNHAQIGKPNLKWTDPKSGTTFGAITSAFSSSPVGTGTWRQMQFSLRLTF
jgi:hypothetical protein